MKRLFLCDQILQDLQTPFMAHPEYSLYNCIFLY